MTPDDLVESNTSFATGDSLIKSQMRVRVRAARLPAAQDLISKLEAAYDARVELMMKDIEKVLKRADVRKSLGLYVVTGGRSDDLRKAGGGFLIDDLFKAKAKAAPADDDEKRGEIKAPGSRGGKWYRDKHGKIRYGVPPANQPHIPLTEKEAKEHAGHYRPGPFMGRQGADGALVQHLILNGEKYDFSEDETVLLQWWYGSFNEKTGKWQKGGSGLEAFMDVFGLHADDMKGDLSKLRFSCEEYGLHNASYDAAVYALLSRQNWHSDDEEDEDVLQDRFAQDCAPVLKKLFTRYENLKKNPAVAEHVEKAAIAAQQEEQETFDYKVNDLHEVTKSLLGAILTDTLPDGSVDPQNSQNAILSALAAHDLIFIPGTGQTKKAADLKGSIAPNVTAVGDHGSILYTDTSFGGKPNTVWLQMNEAQLMLTYIASRLYDSWDGESRKYVVSPAEYSNIQHTALALLKNKGFNPSMFQSRLEAVVSSLAERLTKANIEDDFQTASLVKNGYTVTSDADAAAEVAAKIAEYQNLRGKALAAQENDKFAVPKSMSAGVFGAEHHKKPMPHQTYKDEETGETKTIGLFRHQRQCLNWMDTVKRGVVALDAGLGKTPTVITFMEHLKEQGKAKKAILFLPPSLMHQWPSEIAKYAPGVTPDKILNLAGFSLAERKEALQSDLAKNAEYIIISTGTLTDASTAGSKKGGETEGGVHDEGLLDDGTGGSDDELVSMLKKLDGAVFIDEVHSGGYKEGNTVRHKIANQVIGNREYAFGLTATPMPNSPLDLFHLTNLFARGSVGDLSDWQGAFHNVEWDPVNETWNALNPDQLVKMRSRTRPFVFNKLITDDDVVEDMKKALPPKMQDPDLGEIHAAPDHPIWEHLKPGGIVDQKAKALFARLVQKAIDSGDGDKAQRLMEAAPLVLGSLRDNLSRLACISPELYDPTYKGGSPKIDRMVSDIIKHFKGGGGTEDKPCVVFSSLPNKAFPIIKRELVKAGFDPSLIGEIHGGKSSEERAFEQDMTNEGKRKILLVGTKSGGAGLNLQKKANRVFHLDQPLDPASKRQAIGRVWRLGQKHTVMESNYVLASPYEETWDQKTTRSVARKAALQTAMLTDVDITSLDFSKKATDFVDQLGLSGGVKALLANASAAASAAKTSASSEEAEELLGDLEESSDTGTTTLTDEVLRSKYLDPKVQAKLSAQAKSASEKLDVKEERRLWDRSFQMNQVLGQWAQVELRVKLAKDSGSEKALATATKGVAMLANRCAGWYKEVCEEAKTHAANGNKALADSMTKAAEKFRQSLPPELIAHSSRQKAIDKLVAKAAEKEKAKAAKVAEKEKAKAAKVAEKEKAQAKAKAAKEKATAAKEKAKAKATAAKEKAAAAKAAAKEKAAAAKEKAQAKATAAKEKAAAKPSAYHTVVSKNPFNKKTDAVAHTIFEAWKAKPPKTREEAEKTVLKVMLKYHAFAKKPDAAQLYKHAVTYMKKQGAFAK